ncbi:MAG: sulfite exporter TauE/SafE family protein [Candidatus Lokiarchaeota archaeon]|nr:sulfite exporter TauE/SafE family protein [Candidatus Lokiarchaeota archaeon]
MLIYFILILLGVIYGTIAPILGIGGGFFFVPTLNILFSLDIHVAISTSMFVILFTSMSGTIRYYFTGRINKEIIKIGLILSITSILGAILGSIFKEFLTSDMLKIIFSIFIIFIGAYMVFQSLKEKPEDIEKKSFIEMRIMGDFFNKFNINGSLFDKDNKKYDYSLNLILILPISFLSGVVSGLLGIGGGFINVPTLNILCHVPMHFAVATSTFMIIFAAITNNITNFIISYIDIFLGLILALGTIIGAQIGPKIVEKISSRNLKILFGLFTIGFSIYYIFT